MRKKNYKGRVVKRLLPKCADVCRTYDPIMTASAVAAKKGETGMAIGNVIGSNIFNLLFILGISAMIHPVAVNLASVYDMIILVIVSGISFVFAFTSKKISRVEGALMLLIYIADVVYAIIR